jgi:V/A-type H+-transporting ATPase subunit I
MSRVAVVSPRTRTRAALVELARAGCVELVGSLPPPEGEEAEALRRLNRLNGDNGASPVLLARPVDAAALEQAGEPGPLAGEVELKRRAHLCVDHGSFSAWVGWAPSAELEPLNERLAGVGAAVVELPRPPLVDPPTLLQPVAVERPFRPLVQTYGTARYRDLDPTPFTVISFIVMFGMMFGDVGHGLVLMALALLLRTRRHGRLAQLQHFWVIVFAAGVAGACFGVLYGEAFGPTGLVPTLWLDPIEQPVPLLLVAVTVGAVLLFVSYLLGIVNRWRESGPAGAVLAQYGVAGLAVFVGGLIFFGGYYWDLIGVEVVGGVVAVIGAALLGLGLQLEAGRGPAAVTQAGIGLLDALVRLASNLISFTRLAAFGLMHAALGLVVFEAAQALWGGVAGVIAAVVVFFAGNLIAFALEALVTGVQALRLEYYELYSRIFSGEGQPFNPWSMPVLTPEEES